MTTAVETRAEPRARELPGLIGLCTMRTRFELKGLLRSKDAVVFSLALPVMLLLLFGLMFEADTIGETGVTVGQWFTPGIVAASVLSAGIVNLAITMAIERRDGTLRRLALTPLPASAYLFGKVATTFIIAAGMTVALLGVGVAAFEVVLPSDPTAWLTFAWVFLLGVIAAAVLGVALSAIPRSAKSAGVVFTPPFLFLQFISGVYIDFASIPSWMRVLAGVFPLRWLAAGMRSVFLPPEFRAVRRAGRRLPARARCRGPGRLGRRGPAGCHPHIPVRTRAMSGADLAVAPKTTAPSIERKTT